jgi:hypothetical protein
LAITASSSRGTSGRTATRLGIGSEPDAVNTSSGTSPGNGVCPAKNSYRITPNDQMSVRASTLRGRRACSGDMYAGEPSKDCAAVRFGAGSELPSGVIAFEIPKSNTFTSGDPSGRCVRNRLAGLRSRWIKPRECASATASHAWST